MKSMHTALFRQKTLLDRTPRLQNVSVNIGKNVNLRKKKQTFSSRFLIPPTAKQQLQESLF